MLCSSVLNQAVAVSPPSWSAITPDCAEHTQQSGSLLPFASSRACRYYDTDTSVQRWGWWGSQTAPARKNAVRDGLIGKRMQL